VIDDRPRIGVSACLLGEPVRYDAGHKRDPFLVDVFGLHVAWVPVCPEVEAGFGTPRESMRLITAAPEIRAKGARIDPSRISLVLVKSGTDVTERVARYSEERTEALAAERLSGYVLKKDSPSCGMNRVKVYTAGGLSERAGRGLFAEALIARMPSLPVEEEGRLSDPPLRENFIERVFAYQRLRRLFDSPWSVGDLVRFHTAHKLTLMAHSPVAYRGLGQLVANAHAHARADLEAIYQTRFMTAMSIVATPKRHANVLQHMLGYFKNTLDADARAEILELIEEHRQSTVPLIVPLTLMRHHVRRHQVTYLQGQTYLEPHPRELSLRNHV
jgi:uncharacterized protein YbgA (DUF1722 family)/uncharacterized protein YbbK (DUF523 family)